MAVNDLFKHKRLCQDKWELPSQSHKISEYYCPKSVASQEEMFTLGGKNCQIYHKECCDKENQAIAQKHLSKVE